MTVSVIVPTYNGAHKILTVLDSIAGQTVAPDEVLVVIDGSTDGTREILAGRKFPFRSFRIIEQENGGRARVRNTGAASARSGLLIFFDDDMRPAPECIEKHLDHHMNHPGSIMTGSQIEEVKHDTPDFIRFKASLSRKWYKPYYPQRKLESRDELFLTAANFSITKDLFNTLKGFDERLTDAEDHDLAVRAFLGGIALYVNPEAFAWHDDPVTCASYIRRQKQYAAAHLKLESLRPEIYVHDHAYLTTAKSGMKNRIFAFFSNPFWIQSIDRNWWTKILPRKLRYRLYDIVITANYKKQL